ncbi:MAG: rhomboid family intramembrane serine protease [Candidatus Neomarinimicrobiota bacterium]|nr:MAG: rhomboid family intramembrane serine protease [Candidatus Neomarinimicrobiota bacterium]
MRYQFQSEQGDFSFRPRIFTEAIKILIGVNIIIFLLKIISQNPATPFFNPIVDLFGLSSSTVWPRIWQPFTYLFIPKDFLHVFFNMFVLWMFGSELESIWGRKAFLRYYFTTGVSAGFVWLMLNLSNANHTLAGASGAVYGILLAFGMMFPNRTVYLYFLFPIKVKYLVMFLVATEFILSMSTTSDISHITHLSAVVIGFVYLRYFWRWKDIRFSIRKYVREFGLTIQNQKETRRTKLQQEVDQILDKINTVGYDGLSKEEKETLYATSRKLYRNRQKD